jgi:hypothetical protein
MNYLRLLPNFTIDEHGIDGIPWVLLSLPNDNLIWCGYDQKQRIWRSYHHRPYPILTEKDSYSILMKLGLSDPKYRQLVSRYSVIRLLLMKEIFSHRGLPKEVLDEMVRFFLFDGIRIKSSKS